MRNGIIMIEKVAQEIGLNLNYIQDQNNSELSNSLGHRMHLTTKISTHAQICYQNSRKAND